MKWKLLARWFLVWALLAVTLLFPGPIWADPTDTGTIVVTGTVPPKGTSIQTQLDLDLPQNTLQQGQEFLVTLTYGSSNTSSIPLTFQAKWDKGQVAGATEASVNLTEYVVGSATPAYGGVAPVVDTQSRTITWTVPSLPAQLQNQTVSFKLRTTSAYTGSQKVSMPISMVVISPVGATDRTAKINYKYTPTTESSSGASSPTSTPTPSSTPTATAAAQIRDTAPTKLHFEHISLKTVGAISARIKVQTNQSTGLVVKHGQAAAALDTAVLVAPPASLTAGQDVILVGLEPDTRYFFQVAASSQPNVTSDIFTFETSAKLPTASTREPKALTVTQQRSIIYSGEVIADRGEAQLPIMVAKSTVMDVSLQIPNSTEVQSVELFLRTQGVLGASTDQINADDLSSVSTVMTRVSGDLYVGKLRTPVEAGNYELVTVVEDIYGNIEENSVGDVNVVAPFTILDAKSGKPLEHVEVKLFLFNERTKLYEIVSNVSTSIPNPVFSGADGTVSLNLFPGKYKAEIELSGYETQHVLFVIGSYGTSTFPKVALVPTSNLVGHEVSYLWGLLNHAYNHQIELFWNLTSSRRMYDLFVVLTLLSLGFVVLAGIIVKRFSSVNPWWWIVKPYRSQREKVLMWLAYMLSQWVRFVLELWLTISLIAGGFFWYHFGLIAGGVVFIVAVLTAMGWMALLTYLHKNLVKMATKTSRLS